MQESERAYLLERCLKLEQEIVELRKQARVARPPKRKVISGPFRECTGCRQIKVLAAFRRDATKPSGYRGRCRDCQRSIDQRRVRPNRAAQQRAFYAEHPEKRREYQQRWKERNPEKAKEHARKSYERRKARQAA
jgi:hypothetical protein